MDIAKMFLVNGLIDKSIAYSLLAVDTSSSFVAFNKSASEEPQACRAPDRYSEVALAKLALKYMAAGNSMQRQFRL
jgi:hypothetical protein